MEPHQPQNAVQAWEEDIIIPTYEIGKPDKNPMFLENRVYQGSSGVIYPHPFIDKISDQKVDKKYHALFLENKYLKIMILPELGGRVQMALDKTNNYHFVYYNRVIKPALVGLVGPWISGGIEFNWPQHHRPSTFDPVDFAIQENEDGSKTIWISEIEKMFRTKGMAGFTLYPDKAYLEIQGKLYNRTSIPQTFLWWVNPAVHVDDHYNSVFPPDVQAVFDHGRRDVSTFPIATGTYYKIDYSPGTDISQYKNIPVPTSYMAAESKYDFVGGYHNEKKAGLLHVADHHISPGKKQWTWGNGDFGQAWDRNLTDEDGPYFELMTGMFTDNQPDFSWIQPYEEKTFTQHFFPYKELGLVKNATVDALVNLELKEKKVEVKVYVTSKRKHLVIRLQKSEQVIYEKIVNLSPEKAFVEDNSLELDDPNEFESLKLSVCSEEGEELVSYIPEKKAEKLVPNPAKPALQPKDVPSNEQLYLTGLHLEQYRHALYSPIDYYLEALRRDPGDIRNNNAYGLWLFRRGQFSESEKFFAKAIETLIARNPNPYDGEPYYNLGLALKMQGKHQQAYDAFYKAIWNAAWQDTGFYSLAQIAAIWKKYSLALEHINKSLVRNYHHHKGRHLKITLLRKLGKLEQAKNFAEESLQIDLFNFGALYELYLISTIQNNPAKAQEYLSLFQSRTRGNSHSFIEISIDYCQAGFFEEAISLLSLIENKTLDPMVYYYLGYYHQLNGNHSAAPFSYKKAQDIEPEYCFPNRLEDILVLESAIKAGSAFSSKAHYYLGNLWYDKRQYIQAIHHWEESAKLNPDFPTVHRNLAIAYFNKNKDPAMALESLEKAFELDQTDSRVLYELDQLYKKLNRNPQERLLLLEKYRELVSQRDDLSLEFITLLNLCGRMDLALALLEIRKFHPWEGGEGKVTGQYIYTLVELAKKAIGEKEYAKAIELLQKTVNYPHNLGEGKLHGAQENDIHYYFGCAYEGLGDLENAFKYFEQASVGLDEPAAAIFYNDQPPEKIFYQGKAMLKLERKEEAERKFNKLIMYGETHINDQVSIDYFAVSLPDMLIFDDDLTKRNVIHCNFLIGLGCLGLGKIDEAMKQFKKVLEMDANHIGAKTHLDLVLVV